MEEIGKKASLRVNWVEEVGYENVFPGLDSRRYDVFAGGLWPNASRAKASSFSIPVFYSVIKAWGRTEMRMGDLQMSMGRGAAEAESEQHFCPNCGKPDKGDRFCGSCGKEVRKRQ